MVHLSFPRKRESRTKRDAAVWTPAFAGVTFWVLFLRFGCPQLFLEVEVRLLPESSGVEDGLLSLLRVEIKTSATLNWTSKG
jgi:hypothetical protein